MTPAPGRALPLAAIVGLASPGSVHMQRRRRDLTHRPRHALSTSAIQSLICTTAASSEKSMLAEAAARL